MESAPMHLPIEANFLPLLNNTQAEVLDTTLRVFDEAMRKANTTYFIIDGSVIGSYRHHGRIPWDGDIDVMVLSSDEDRVAKALTDHHPDYGLYMYIDSGILAGALWKFYYRHSDPIVGYPHTYPFLDIFFYYETSTHVVRTSPFFPRASYLKQHVFPLQLRPYGDMMVPSPCDPVGFLADIGIDVSRCLTGSSQFDSPVEVDCSVLMHAFPFVHRTAGQGADSQEIEEVLSIGGRKIRSVRLSSKTVCDGKL